MSAFVHFEGRLRDVDFVLHFGVRTDEESDSCEDETEEAADVRQNHVDFADGPRDRHTLRRFINIDRDVFRGGNGDRIRLEGLNEAARRLLRGSDGQRIGVRIDGELRHVNVTDRPYCIREGHKNVLFDDVSDGVVAVGSDDGVHQKEPNIKIVVVCEIIRHIRRYVRR